MCIRELVWGAALLVSLPCLARPAAAQPVIDSDTFGGIEARSIGPAAMSGRVAAIDAVAGDRVTLWVGAASGGVWKSVDGGLTFKPVFDKHAQSIGAVTVDPSNPDIVWVGTGETWVRNTVSMGDGVYRTTDGGETWTKLGLENSERIARIIVDPKNGKRVFVCVTGHLFDDHPERGVYRTEDGGKTWKRVLHVADNTGCSSLAMDPRNARTLYAGMWPFRRTPDFFNSGGATGGLYKSTDGGSTWRKLTRGLPEGDVGRIAVAVSPVNPKLVFATIEAKRTALYRSEDRGKTWKRINDSSPITGRPFYFSSLVPDPKHVDRLYKPGFVVAVSDDGGKTFGSLSSGFFGTSYHVDVHALWVNPTNPEHLIIGTDGGVYISYDRGAHWRFAANLPLSQFYHVSHDNAWPYNVYGGLQDNSTWYGPSRRSGPIANRHWEPVLGGDGFWAFVDPTDEDVMYAEYQGGRLFRIRKSTGETKDIRPSPKAGEPKYRFNWNTPIHLSRRDPKVVYYGAQFLFRSRDRGETWTRISDDLTTNDPKKLRQKESGGLTLDNSTAENHCTIFTISESPKNAKVIWVGTDDGNLQVTRNGGRTWKNVAKNVKGLPAGTWVSSIEASHFDAGTAFVSFDGHMTGDTRPYVFKTTDYGRTWQALAGAPMKWFARVVKQDLKNRNLLFVGTEWGLYISIDGGKSWAQFKGGLPNVPVHDLVIHPREHDLIIGTHGRGIYIIDDLTPLRSLTPEKLAADVAFLDSRPSTLLIPGGFGSGFSGDTEFSAPSPGEAAYITYHLKRRHIFGDLKLDIYGPDGKLISTLPGGKRRGINRVELPMRSRPPRTAAGAEFIFSLGAFFGPRALPGTYTVKLTKGSKTLEHRIRFVVDPRSKHKSADRKLQYKTAQELYGLVERLGYLVSSIEQARDDARARGGSLPKEDKLSSRLSGFADAMEAQRVALVSTSRGEGISGDEKLREELGILYGNVNGYDGRPTNSQMAYKKVLEAELGRAEARFDKAFAANASGVNQDLEARKLPPIQKLSKTAWQSR